MSSETKQNNYIVSLSHEVKNVDDVRYLLELRKTKWFSYCIIFIIFFISPGKDLLKNPDWLSKMKLKSNQNFSVAQQNNNRLVKI